MADIGAQETPKKGGKKTLKKKVVRIDMTPMVDLMCLLITFFMLTTAFSKPKIMEIILPEKIKSEKEKAEAPKIAKSRTLNIILGPDNKVLWYTGAVDDPRNPPPLQITDFGPNGIRQLLLERNRALFKKIDQFQKDVIAGKINIKRDSLEAAIRQLKNEDDTGPIVLIKPYKKSTYGNFVDILDEMSIVGIARYTIVDIAPIEEQMVEKALGITPEPEINN
ncbi:MAG: biopolymer transporter ExbD [Bacteroidales bacterium]|nr:biopolymer transporter ExbD [Bacteroidales bacterium]